MLAKHENSKFSVVNTWSLFTASEKRNIAIYITGIMLYKFGLEAFNGSIIALATNRYTDPQGIFGFKGQGIVVATRLGLLTGLNQAFQCVGSILIAPLVKRFPTRLVLSCAIFVFGLLTAVLLIVDAATGGRIKPAGAATNDYSYYGRYNTEGIIPIYCITGIAYGMVELIRRIIPRDIVGGDVQKLRRMDALVHIFYEITGTAGAFCTALALIPALGTNMAFLITPICFTFAGIAWFFISNLAHDGGRLKEGEDPVFRNRGIFVAILLSFKLFWDSVYTGGKILFSSRKFVWLVPGYALALYGHRYLENGIAPNIARQYFNNSAWSQIMVGGSNFGELLGALFVFLFTNWIKTPLPWLRLDALMLLIVWYLPYWYPPRNDVNQAWIAAATFIPVSFGWAAGDVSLAAYIQAMLQRQESKHKNVSALGAVMAFLYCTYIVLYAVLGTLLGRHIDDVQNRTGSIREAIRNVGGIQFTILAAIVISATLIPRGAIAFNPRALFDETLESDDENVKFVGTGANEDGNPGVMYPNAATDDFNGKVINFDNRSIEDTHELAANEKPRANVQPGNSL